jgi:hypothetical protein
VKNLNEYMTKKKAKEWDLVQCKVERGLSKKFKEELKKDGYSITHFVEAAMMKYLDEKNERLVKSIIKKK